MQDLESIVPGLASQDESSLAGTKAEQSVSVLLFSVSLSANTRRILTVKACSMLTLVNDQQLPRKQVTCSRMSSNQHHSVHGHLCVCGLVCTLADILALQTSACAAVTLQGVSYAVYLSDISP